MEVVSLIMTPEPVCIDEDESLDQALACMEAHSVRHMPVIRRECLVGVISDRDLLEATGWLPSRVHACRGVGNAPTLQNVGELMHAAVVTIDPEATLVDASAQFIQYGIGCLPVVDEERVVGIVTEMDLLRAYTQDCEGSGWCDLKSNPPVREVMTPEPASIHWFTTLEEATEICKSRDLRHLPVLEAGVLVGMVSDRDLRRARGVGRPGDTPVDEFMTRTVVAGQADMPLSEVAKLMVQHGISSLAISELDELLGIVTTRDLLEHFLGAYHQSQDAAEGRRIG